MTAGNHACVCMCVCGAVRIRIELIFIESLSLSLSVSPSSYAGLTEEAYEAFLKRSIEVSHPLAAVRGKVKRCANMCLLRGKGGGQLLYNSMRGTGVTT